MRVDRLQEPDVEPWKAVLDDAERARAARFVPVRSRVEFVAAHALARAALAAATGQSAVAFRFEPGAHGKPTARIGGAPAGVHFNLSHTRGLVAVAVAPFEHGLDVEPLDRAVNLGVAGHYFCPEEIAWLDSLPEAGRPEGFLRLWTLKEAFIKATGLGLSQGLDTFWFQVFPPAIRFKQPAAGDPADWRFDQRAIDGGFLAATGFHDPDGRAPTIEWKTMSPAALAATLAA